MFIFVADKCVALYIHESVNVLSLLLPVVKDSNQILVHSFFNVPQHARTTTHSSSKYSDCKEKGKKKFCLHW
jgi:hypothetical protein